MIKEQNITINILEDISAGSGKLLQLVYLFFKQYEFNGNYVNDKMNGYGHMEDKLNNSDYKGCFLNN